MLIILVDRNNDIFILLNVDKYFSIWHVFVSTNHRKLWSILINFMVQALNLDSLEGDYNQIVINNFSNPFDLTGGQSTENTLSRFLGAIEKEFTTKDSIIQDKANHIDFMREAMNDLRSEVARLREENNRLKSLINQRPSIE